MFKAFIKKWGTTEHTTANGKKYLWDYQSGGRKNPPISTLIVAAPLPFNFSIEHEKFYHWLIKRLGMAKEFQTNHGDFDRKFYIFSDDAQFCNLLRGDEMRRRIQRLFELGVNELKTEKESLKATMKKPSATPDPLTADELVDILYSIYEQAARIPVIGLLTPGKTMAARASLAHGFMIGLLVIGIGGTLLQPYDMLEYLPLIREAALYALIVAVTLFFMLRVLFQESSRGVTIFLAFLYAGLPGIAFCSYLAIYAINVFYDHSEAEVHLQHVDKKYISRSKNSTYYYFYTANWRHPNEPLKLETDYALYHSTHTGTRLSIYTHPGYLNHEWIESFQVGR